MEPTSPLLVVPEAEGTAAATLHFFQAQEAELSHLARELHDQVGQILTLVSLSLGEIKCLAAGANRVQLEECCQMVDSAIDQVRSLSVNLRPPLLDELGLEATVGWHLHRMAARTGWQAHFDCPAPLVRLHPDLEIAGFRIVQESVTNITRHARAKRVCVRLAVSGTNLEISVRDDGVGFDPGKKGLRAMQEDKFGLRSMQQRAAFLGGTLEIKSQPARGTLVRAQIPLSPSDTGHVADHGPRHD